MMLSRRISAVPVHRLLYARRGDKCLHIPKSYREGVAVTVALGLPFRKRTRSGSVMKSPIRSCLP